MKAFVAAPTEDQYAGLVIGQCLGDALGFVVEGRPPEACRAYVRDVLDAGAAGGRGRAPFPFGQYTDDSQLARELLESYVERRGFDAADYAGRVADIFASGRIVGRGRTTEAAALRLARGVPWHEAGTPAPNAGNGSAMRAAPVALMFWDSDDALLAAAHDQGRVTHADPRCSAGAAAIAGAAALALRGELADAGHAIGRLEEWSGRFDGGFARELGRLRHWLALAPEDAAPEIAQAGLQPGFSDRWRGISPFVTSSVLWALYSVLRTPGGYWDTVRTAIAVGGDVDTTAAMAGAVSGAMGGLSAVPPHLAEKLNDRGRWGRDALVGLARRAFALKAALSR